MKKNVQYKIEFAYDGAETWYCLNDAYHTLKETRQAIQELKKKKEVKMVWKIVKITIEYLKV